MPHFIFADLNETVRLDPKVTSDEVLGLVTSSLKTCTAVIVRGTESNRISLTHYGFVTDPKALRNEINWVGEPFEIILAKNQEAVLNFQKNHPVGETHTGNNDTEKNIIDYIRANKWAKNVKKRLDTKTETVFVNRAGEVTVWKTEEKEICESPHSDLRNAISYLNSVYTTPPILPTLEFDGRQFTSLLNLLQVPLFILSAIKIRMDKFKLEVTEENVFDTLKSVDIILKEQGGIKGAHLHILNADPECKKRVLASMCNVFKSGTFKSADFGDIAHYFEADLLPNKLRK